MRTNPGTIRDKIIDLKKKFEPLKGKRESAYALKVARNKFRITTALLTRKLCIIVGISALMETLLTADEHFSIATPGTQF